MQLTFTIKGNCGHLPAILYFKAKRLFSALWSKHIIYKILRIMKLTAIIIFLAVVGLRAETFSQTVTIRHNALTLRSLFEQIHKQTGFSFIFDQQLLTDNGALSLKLIKAPLKEVLDLAVKSQGLDYSILHKTIVISGSRSRPIVKTEIRKDTLIQGIVTDSIKRALPGVSVFVKGKTNVGTTTDLNGRYSIKVPENSILVFKMVGFVVTERVPSKSVIDVVLAEDNSSLNEVQVVAFGTQKKESVVGAITSVNPAELKIPSSNLTNALAGRVAGVIAYQRSGEPGADNASFFIRGVTTFGYKKDPLILIDGVEVTTTALARLQVDDIANFSILKDATATALYGARGANGVILISTKEGKEGKPVYSIRLENSISQPTQSIQLADPITFMQLGNEAILTRFPLGITPYPQEKIDNTIAGTNKYAYPATDWLGELFKKQTINQRGDVNISGGASVAKYYISASFAQDNGILNVPQQSNFNNNINLKSYSVRSNVNINLTKSTLLTTRISGSFEDYVGPINGGAAVYNAVMHTNPVLFPAYYAPDNANAFAQHLLFGNYGTGGYNNPYADMVKGYKNYTSSTVSAQLELKQSLDFITQGLTFNAMANTNRYAYYDVSRSYTPFYYAMGSYDKPTGNYILNAINPTTGTEYLEYPAGGGTKTINTSVYMQSILNYNRLFNNKHGASATLVYQMQNSISGNFTSLQTSLPSRNLGVSGRATYTYDRRYYAEFNFGYNGSERFDKTNRFGFFPSVGVAWNISNEAFWKKFSSTITNLKLRGTYGLVGNDAIGSATDRFFYISEVNMNDAGKSAAFGRVLGSLYGKNGVTVLRYANPDISWEVAHMSNIGMDMSLWNKLNVVAELYKTYRSNILMDRTNIPGTMGLSNVPRANVGAATSKGIDASVDYNQTINKSWWIQGRANFTLAKSKYDKYEEPIYDNEPWLSRLGYSLSQNRGYIAERLFVDDFDVNNSPTQSFGAYGAGDIKYRDINGDGAITVLDKVPIGFPTDPEIVYGFGLTAGYKSFDVSFFLQGQGKSSFWIDPTATAPFANQNALLKAYADDHWSEDNRNIYSLWPRLSSDVNLNNTQVSTWFMRNGQFLRLKQVEMGYSLPPKILEKWKIKSARLYINGSNLFTLSSFKLWDIEMAGNGLGYPVQQVLNIGIQTSF
jgi:TonB-linked SusC/RagA family outer membrane protein